MTKSLLVAAGCFLFLTPAFASTGPQNQVAGKSFTWARKCQLSLDSPQMVDCKSTLAFKANGTMTELDLPGDPDEGPAQLVPGTYSVSNDQIIVKMDNFSENYQLSADGRSLTTRGVAYTEDSN